MIEVLWSFNVLFDHRHSFCFHLFARCKTIFKKSRRERETELFHLFIKLYRLIMNGIILIVREGELVCCMIRKKSVEKMNTLNLR